MKKSWIYEASSSQFIFRQSLIPNPKLFKTVSKTPPTFHLHKLTTISPSSSTNTNTTTITTMPFSHSPSHSRDSMDSTSSTLSFSTTYSLQKPTQSSMPLAKPTTLFSRLFRSTSLSPEDRERKEMKRQQRKLDFEEVKRTQRGMMGGQLGSSLT
jgi:hypothetical protein